MLERKNEMHTALWIAQLALAVLYVLAGLWKLAGPAPSLEGQMPSLPLTLIRMIGLAETLAALGLALPAVAPRSLVVAGWAAAILAAEAVVFLVYHVQHGARVPAVAMLVLGLLAGFVAWGRLK